MMLLLEEFTADIPGLEQQLKHSDGDTMWGGLEGKLRGWFKKTGGGRGRGEIGE